MLEWSVLDVRGVTMGNRVQEGRDFPSHVVEVIPPVEEVNSVMELEQDST
jgi:hypothetical protein